jgi:glyoxylase-like metal-dependent hydrolase (beta-lactamase superfamily II)
MTIAAARAAAIAALLLVALPAATLAATAPAAPRSSAAVTALLDRADMLMAWPTHGVITLEYKGRLTRESHFEHPHATRTYESLRRVYVASPERIRQDFSTWVAGDTVLGVETTLLIKGHVLHRDDETAPWVALTGREAAMATRFVRGATPALALADAREHAARATIAGAGGKAPALSWPDSTGRVWTLHFDGTNAAPVSFESATANDWEGDIADSTVFGPDRPSAGFWASQSLHTRTHETDDGWWLDETLQSAEWHSAPTNAYEAVNGPRVEEVMPAPAAGVADSVPVLVPLAPHVWAVELPDADTRSVVMEFADHLVVLDASAGSRQGEAILATIHAKLPRKPVRFVAFSHYHPDYTGGLRPFLADSIKVLCAPGNADYVREIAARRFTRHPDRLELMQRRSKGGWIPQLELLGTPVWTHADSANELRVIDIGTRSNHTDSYLVFVLPRDGIVFEGDLGFFTRGGKRVASRRARGLVLALDAAGVKCERVVQGWPVKGNASEIKMRELRELVAPQRP